MPYPKVDPLDWSTVQPHVDALLARELTPDSVQDWLQQWSDLESVLYETAAAIQRAVSENTADKEAERRFLLMVEHMLPQMKLANQALRDKLSAFGDYSPPADQQVMLRRFRAESSIFRPENVTLESIAEVIGEERTREITDASLALYKRGSEIAESHHIILADTKYEFGMHDGRMILIDEVFTPDSSRFWPRDSWEPGHDQENLDKQVLRDYLETLDWDKKPPPPPLPDDIIDKTAATYRYIKEVLIGE